MVLPLAISLNLIFDVTVGGSSGSSQKIFCIRLWVQILILIKNSFLFKFYVLGGVGAEQSSSKVIAKIVKLGFKSLLLICNADFIIGHR